MNYQYMTDYEAVLFCQNAIHFVQLTKEMQ